MKTRYIFGILVVALALVGCGSGEKTVKDDSSAPQAQYVMIPANGKQTPPDAK